jgi:outer membrane biosynthesis protein TonB
VFTLVVTVVLVIVVGAVMADLLYGPEQPATPGTASHGDQWEPWRSWYRSLREWLARVLHDGRRTVPAVGRQAGRSTRRLVTAAVVHPTDVARTTGRSVRHRLQARAERHAAHARHLAHVEHLDVEGDQMHVPPAPEAPAPEPREPQPEPVVADLAAAEPAGMEPFTTEPLLDEPVPAFAPSAPAPPSPPQVTTPTPAPTPTPVASTAPPPPPSPATAAPPPAAPPPLQRSMLPGLTTPPGGVSAARPPAPMLDYGAGEVITGEHPIPVQGRRGPGRRGSAPGRRRRPAGRGDEPAPRRSATRAGRRAPDGAIVPLQIPWRERLRALAILGLVCIVGGVVAASGLVILVLMITRALANV